MLKAAESESETVNRIVLPWACNTGICLELFNISLWSPKRHQCQSQCKKKCIQNLPLGCGNFLFCSWVLEYILLVCWEGLGDFPGGLVVEDSPANAWSLVWARSHVLRSSWVGVPQHLSPVPTTEPATQLLKPTCPELAPHNKTSHSGRTCALQWRVAPARCSQRKTVLSNEGPGQPKTNK